MATKKISELEEINQAENDDYLVVVDTSESKNKKITKENFLKISALEEKISDLENNQLTASTEGTSIDINDSADYQVREMIPNGNVIQNGTTGKNLFNMDGNPIVDRLSSAGYTLKYNDDKTITINGTGTGAYKYLTWNLTLEAGTYIANGCPSGGSQNGYSFLIDVGSSSYWDYGNGVSFTLTARTTIQLHPIRTGSDIPTFNNVTFKPMIRLSSITDASYEPYTGGIASPNPQYEQPINSAGDAKNLYFLPEEGSSDGINYTKNDDGTINLVGTATAAVTFPIFKSIAEAQIENGATYTFSSNQALPSGVEFRAEAFTDSSWLRHLIGSVLNNSNRVFTGTANLTDATRIRHLIYIASGTTVNLTNLEIQFEKGSVKTSFTPEGKGSINEVISNKNSLPAINGSYISYELTTNWEGNTATINGTCTQTYSNFMGSSLIPIYLTADEYTISASDYTYNYTFRFQLKDGTIENTNIVGRSSTIEFTQDVVAYRCWIYRSDLSSVTFSNYKVSFQIEKGSSATSFVPHQEQNISIPCQQPMRSIGNVRDSFVKIDGTWYEKHNIGQVVLSGSENWISQTQTGFYRYGLADSVINNETSYASQIIIKSNSFKGITFNNRNSDTNETIYAVSNGQQHNLFINTNSYTTLNDFKNWLTGNNTEVIYLLAEPIYLECTEEQITALEQARTYKPVTHISSADVVPAYLEVTYVRDLETVINNLS